MMSKTRLESAIFQLTPTRTRCDLYIVANGEKEKVTSGLLNPFVTHLKTAQDQIAEGGYSILLQPDPASNPTWFTKCTVESFVRFVSTPEILERVYTIESEILQIEEAIVIQGNNGIEMEDHQVKPVASNEGNRTKSDADEEKAIVLYKPDAQPTETSDSNAQEGNPKVQLLKVLQTRKAVLQKEQSMAFARAVAAGFAIDRVADLVSFAECFGASRLMNAGLRFIDFYKKRYDSGQWLEIEAVDMMSSKSDFSTTNAAGILLSSTTNRHKEPRNEVALEANEKTGSDPNAGSPNPAAQQEYYPGQFLHPVYPPWAIHSSPGAVPVYQAYPMQGMPYYQHYPGNDSLSPRPYPSMEDPCFYGSHITGQKRQFVGNRDCNPVSETQEMDAFNMRYQNDIELENEGSSQSLERHKKTGKSGKKHSGMVVIRNINYITSNRQNSAQDESESASDSDIDEMEGDTHKNTLRSSKRRDNQKKSETESNLHGKDGTFNGEETEGSHWQAFQSYLLEGANEDGQSANEGMFAMGREPQMKRRQKTMTDDPLASAGQDVKTHDDIRRNGFEKDSDNLSRLPRASQNDVLMTKGDYVDGKGFRIDMQSHEANGRSVVYRSANDDFMMSGREQGNQRNLPDPLAGNGFEGVTANLDRSGLHGMDDETFDVSLRSTSIDQDVNDNRTALNMDYELPSRDQYMKNKLNGIRKQVIYEPQDLKLMPERGLEKRSVGYDPALDYEMQLAEDAASNQKKNKEALTEKGSKSAEKDHGTKANKGTSDKKTAGPIRKGKPSKMSPLEDTRARAEKLRSFKADLQKMKKEQQDAERRRLEALKTERQKRIAARANSMSGQSTLPTRKQLPSKFSHMSQRGSKFNDSEPGSSSPLQRSKIRMTTSGSSDSNRPSTCNKSIDGIHLAGNSMTKSVSSLSDTKKKINHATPDSKASMARIRRLSEPKKTSGPTAIPVKSRSAEHMPKPKLLSGPESRKVSAMLNLDRSKAATLPELKIRTSKVSSNESQKISAVKETTAKMKEDKLTVTSEASKWDLNRDRSSHQIGVDNDFVVEKTVVMLEHDQPSNSVIDAAKESGVTKKYNGKHGSREHIEVVSASIHEVPLSMDVVDKGPISVQSWKNTNFSEVRKFSLKEELAEDPRPDSAEKPYQAPYARISSFEDPCRKLDYGKAPQTNFEMMSLSAGTDKAYVSDLNNSKLEKIHEVHEKTRAKEAKGFRRLLKLGKKSHSPSGTPSVIGSEPDDVTIDAAASGEVNTLKHLISQDEPPNTVNTLQKSSRHFSLLSPFRSKTSAKKLTT